MILLVEPYEYNYVVINLEIKSKPAHNLCLSFYFHY